MVRIVRVLLLVPVVLLAGGQVRSADDKALTSPYFPMAVGTTWHYRVGENHYMVKVTKHEKVGELMCARLEMLVQQGKNTRRVSYEHVAVTKDGIVRADFEGKALTPPVVFFKPPAATGEPRSWNVESKMAGQVFRGTFKLGEERNVKVPAGIYSTVTVTGKELDVNGVKMDVTYYFAEKVGMVKQVVELAGQKVVVQLEKFEPAEKKEE